MVREKEVIVNGRRMRVPEIVPEGDIRRMGGIDGKRNLMRRTREGNFLVRPGSSVPVNDGDVFVDAPARVKGSEA